jgi:hypothetical protein
MVSFRSRNPDGADGHCTAGQAAGETQAVVTTQGHRYAQFQRALKTGNAHLALAAAAELRHVDLADALSLVLLIRDDEPLLGERAARRWLSRYTGRIASSDLPGGRDLVDIRR